MRLVITAGLWIGMLILLITVLVAFLSPTKSVMIRIAHYGWWEPYVDIVIVGWMVIVGLWLLIDDLLSR